MFTSFNSVELITVSSLEEQTKLRNLLTQGGVEHMVSVKDPHQASGFFPVPDPETMMTQPMAYTFYVHKKQLQQAVSLLEQEGFV